MELLHAERLARTMMRSYGLPAKGWKFEFDRAKSRLGLTNFTKKKITISKYMVSAATREQVEQIMLHEIAHALLPPSAKHGPQWKTLAKKIGYQGGRTAENPFRPEITKANTAHKAALTVPAHKSGVKIGDRLKLPNGEIVVVKKAARKYFHLKSVASEQWWKVTFGAAINYKI